METLFVIFIIDYLHIVCAGIAVEPNRKRKCAKFFSGTGRDKPNRNIAISRREEAWAFHYQALVEWKAEASSRACINPKITEIFTTASGEHVRLGMWCDNQKQKRSKGWLDGQRGAPCSDMIRLYIQTTKKTKTKAKKGRVLLLPQGLTKGILPASEYK